MMRIYLLLTFLFFICSIHAQNEQIESAKQYLKKSVNLSRLAEDVETARVSDFYYSELSKASFVYLQQQKGGIDIFNAITPVAVLDDGRVINSGHSFIPDVNTKKILGAEIIDRDQALKKAISHLGMPIPKNKIEFKKKRKNFYTTLIPELAIGEIYAEKTYLHLGDELILTWRMEIDSKDNHDLRSVFVSTESGKIIKDISHVIKCNHDDSPLGKNSHRNNIEKSAERENIVNSINSQGDGAQYRVYPYHIESPIHGDQELLIDPSDDVASPFGWHDTDGRAGPEEFITKGNNAHAFQDRNDTDSSDDDEPSGGENLIFDVPHIKNGDVLDNIDADVIQLFYMTNVMHDWLYRLGFDEASGNYQENNLLRGGLDAEDGDPVQANALDALDLGEINNANFTLTSDGRSGRMQMYKFEARISDLFIGDQEFFTGTATFGPGRVTEQLEGDIALVDDGSGDRTDACETIQNMSEVIGNIALIRRGTCFFSEKIFNAQERGAIAAIVCNNVPNDILNMAGATNAALVDIPAYFITKEDCDPIERKLNNGEAVRAKFIPTERINLSSGFDNGIIAHEYAHGLSGRLTGGASRASCLNNNEQMGEGWSDFFGLVITQRESDSGERPRGIGTYVSGLGINGLGFRRFKYSIDTSINAQTMNDIRGTGGSPHALGEVWASVLWDIYWLYIDEYGYDFTWENEESGNFRAVRTIIDGMRLQPCSPGFIEGRDAILAADEMLTGGANQCLLWKGFAARGMGYDAEGGNRQNRTDNINGFETLPSCIKTVKLEHIAPDKAEPDQVVEIQLKAVNHKEETLTNTTVQTKIPSNAEFVSTSSDFTATLQGDILTFDIGDMNSLAEIDLSYDIKVGTEELSKRILFDDFGPGNGFFRNLNASGANNEWQPSTLVKQIGEQSYNIIDDTLATEGLLTQATPILLDQEFPAFRFWHRYITEYGFDGGIVEISEDGGNTWDYVSNDKFMVRGYPVLMIRPGFGFGDPIFGFNDSVEAFTGNSPSWIQSYIDLSSYKGKEVLIRFRWVSDDSQGVPGTLSGWFIDYVEYLDLAEAFGSTCITSDNSDMVCSEATTVINSKEGSTPNNNVVKSEFSIGVYPNPADKNLNVSFTLEKRAEVKININDLNGKLISSRTGSFQAGISTFDIDIKQLPDGVYLLQLNLGNSLYNQKFIKVTE